MSARASRAPAPISTENRAPDMRAARSKSRMPSAVPSSQCGFGSKSNTRRLAATAHFLIVLGAPSDRHACVRQVRQRQQECRALVLRLIELNLELADLLRTRLARGEEWCRVLTLTLRPRHFIARRVLLPLEALDLGD